MKILVTAFDPFDGESMNPALEVAKRLPENIAGAEIIIVEVPTVFYRSAEVMREAAVLHQPDVILNIGQAGGRTGMTPERIAINLDDARIPDNDDQQPIDKPIQVGGQPAYFSTLPIKAMVEAIKDAGLPAYVSNSAGTFVCNHLMYQTLYFAEKELPDCLAGFIHIPFLPGQVTDKPRQASMSLTDMVTGIEAAIKAIVQYQDNDLAITGGTTH